MILATGGRYSVMLSRRLNTWYTVSDGNWSDPTIWMSNALDKKNVPLPRVGDNVVINHNVTIDVQPNAINNLCISGKLSGGSAFTPLTINGDLQATGAIDFTASAINVTLNGYNNYVVTFTGGSSTIVYNGLLSQAIMPITYNNLTTQNSGQKYQIGDVNVSGNFSPQSNYEVGVYNLSVTGSSTIGTTAFTVLFSKNSSTGSILFIGFVDFEGNTNLNGNPNVEFRGGLQIHTFNLTTGSGIFTFSTNNQTINCINYLGGTWNASIVVSGTITLTLSGSTFQVNNTINGTVGGSTFNNDGTLYLGYNSTPMATGVFNYQHSSTSTLGYVFNGVYSLPYPTYANLVVSGTGIKSLSGNTVLSKTFVNNGSFDTNSYNLTVTGAFTHNGNFTAAGFSSIIFIGFAQINTGGGTGFDLTTGNPSVEFRAGLDVHSGSPTKTGTGTWSFTTNNQAVSFSAYNAGTCAANLLVSGAITVTFTSGAAIPDCAGTLNGDNASSIFDNRGTFAYSNAAAPMATGELFCNQATNTFNYNLAGNQDITAPSDVTPGYKNLTLSGSGAKRLLGNVSVKGVYTLTSPATLNSNGFALTNP